MSQTANLPTYNLLCLKHLGQGGVAYRHRHAGYPQAVPLARWYLVLARDIQGKIFPAFIETFDQADLRLTRTCFYLFLS